MAVRKLSSDDKRAIKEQLLAGRPPRLIMYDMRVTRQQLSAFLAWKTIKAKTDAKHQQIEGDEFALKLERKEKVAIERELCREMGKVALRYAKARSAKRGVSCLSYEELSAKWLAQDGRCELSGIKFSPDKLPTKAKVLFRPWFPSLDRIDVRGDYSCANVRIVTQIVNFGLGEWPLTAFYEMCRRVTKHDMDRGSRKG